MALALAILGWLLFAAQSFVVGYCLRGWKRANASSQRCLDGWRECSALLHEANVLLKESRARNDRIEEAIGGVVISAEVEN